MKECPTDNCGCLRWERTRKSLTKHGHSNDYIGAMLYHAKRRSLKLGVPFDITVFDVVVPDRCPYLDIPIFRMGSKQTASSPSLDRIDPSLGYVKGNVQVISYRANAIKHDATFDEFEGMYLRWKKMRGG